MSEEYLDSALVLADLALSFDDKLEDAYIIRGNYFAQHDNKEQALIEYDKAIRFNPNDWRGYWSKGFLFRWGNVVVSLSNYHKAALVHRGDFLPRIYRAISFTLGGAGFSEKALYYNHEAFKLDHDSALYYEGLFLQEDGAGNFENAVELGKKCLSIDSSNLFTLGVLGDTYRLLKQYKEMLEVCKEYEKRAWPMSASSVEYDFTPFGFAYLMNGFKEEAQNYLQSGIEYNHKLLELGRHYVQNIPSYYNLTGAYSILGDVDSALYHLAALTQIKGIPGWVPIKLRVDPMFDNIKDEPEFQQIVRDIEAKYQAEHERVRQWLEENDML